MVMMAEVAPKDVVVAFAITAFANEEVDDALIPFVKFKYVEVELFAKR